MVELTLALLLLLVLLAERPGKMFLAAIAGRFGPRAALTATIGNPLGTSVVTAVIGLGFPQVAGLGSTLFESL